MNKMFTKEMCEIRASWKIGDTCQIFSTSKSKWLNGQIAEITTDDEGEWLEVRYGSSCKQIQRFCKEIRPDPKSIAQQLAEALKRRNENFRRNAPPFSRKGKLRSTTFTKPATHSEYNKRDQDDYVLKDIDEGDENHQKSERRKDLASMSPRQVKDFLRSLGCAYEPYVTTFRRMKGKQLMQLSERRLRKMVPIKLHRHRLLLEVARHRRPTSSIVASVSNIDVLNWSADQVRDWIAKQLVAKQYANLFANHGVDGLLLFELDADDLDTIGVKESHQKRVLSIISRFESAKFPDFKKAATHKEQKKAKALGGDKSATANRKRKSREDKGEKGRLQERLASMSALSVIHSEMDVASMTPSQVQDLVSSLSSAYERHVRKQHGANESSRAVLCTMGQLLLELGQTFKSDKGRERQLTTTLKRF